MKNEDLVLKFEEDKDEFLFTENLSFSDNKKLVKTLEKENIKNSNSSLIVKSMNNLPVYDVIQLKVNIKDTGVFLVNFLKDDFTQEKRETLIEKIKSLKGDEEISLESQKNKINKLISILNNENPIFSVFKQVGDFVVTFEDFKSFEPLKFKLIVLQKPQKALKIKPIKEKKEITDKQPEEKKVISGPRDISETVVIKSIKEVKYTGDVVKPQVTIINEGEVLEEDVDYILSSNSIEIGEGTAIIEFIGDYYLTAQLEIQFDIVEKVKSSFFKEFISKVKNIFKKSSKVERTGPRIDFPLFSFDYLFVSLFALLFGFGLYAGIYELLIEDSIAVFLIILAVIFLGVLYFSVFSTLYKRGKERFKNLKYWLLIYLFVGAAVGIVAGYLITTYAMKIGEDKILDLFLLLIIEIPTVMVLSLVSPLVAKLINYIIKKIKK